MDSRTELKHLWQNVYLSEHIFFEKGEGSSNALAEPEYRKYKELGMSSFTHPHPQQFSYNGLIWFFGVPNMNLALAKCYLSLKAPARMKAEK